MYSSMDCYQLTVVCFAVCVSLMVVNGADMVVCFAVCGSLVVVNGVSLMVGNGADTHGSATSEGG